MTSFAFTIEQEPSGTLTMRMEHDLTKDATDAERQLHDRIWTAMVALGGREKICIIAQPRFPKP